jgi:hypothetical protein
MLSRRFMPPENAALSLQPPEEGQVLPCGQLGIDGQVLGDQADVPPGLDVARPHLLAGDGDRARVGGDQPGDHRDRGGLAGAVGPEQPVGLARGYVEGDPVDGGQVTEPAHQLGDLQHVVVRGLGWIDGLGAGAGHARMLGVLASPAVVRFVMRIPGQMSSDTMIEVVVSRDQ